MPAVLVAAAEKALRAGGSPRSPGTIGHDDCQRADEYDPVERGHRVGFGRRRLTGGYVAARGRKLTWASSWARARCGRGRDPNGLLWRSLAVEPRAVCKGEACASPAREVRTLSANDIAQSFPSLDAGIVSAGTAGGHLAWHRTCYCQVMSDASDLPAKDTDASASFDNATVGQAGKPAGDDDLSSAGEWPVRALGRRATWRFFGQKGGRRS
jgi:hypothetical protein